MTTTVTDSPQDIFNEIERQNNKLNSLNDELTPLMQSVAEKQRDYNILFAQMVIQKKADGIPITIIRDVVKGNRGVADSAMQLYLAEGLYKSVIMKIKDVSSRIEQLRSKLSRLACQLSCL